MKDVNDFIANLSADKRAEFVQKLRNGKEANAARSGKSQEQLLTGNAEKVLQHHNFAIYPEVPGHFKSFKIKPKPILPPADDHVQIRVKATSLNFRDLMIAMNIYSATPGVMSLMGSDYSGVVTAVGRNITEFAPGDEVFFLSAGSLLADGTLDPESHFIEVTNVKPSQIAKKPKGISFHEAACIPTAYLTSYYALVQLARLKKSDRLLVHTATGGVGLSAIQIAEWMGAEVFVTAGTDVKRDYLKSIGYDNPMNSRAPGFGPEILDRTNGEGIDVVLNTLAGDAVTEGLRVLRNFGHFIQLDKKDIAANRTIELGLFEKGLSFSGVDLGLFYLNPPRLKQLLNELSFHFHEGNLKPIRYEAFKITELEKALTVMSKYQHIGKIVLEY